MLLGFEVKAYMLIAGGSALFLLLVLQVLVGKRKIKFKGPLHLKVHRWLAYAMLVFAALHGLFALAYAGII